ncbi:MAG TPA: helix-turn-helix transcriptional regulator [Verrucomicrobiae bacterium]|jgi:transcriptional regulator with XRE-family HTH domain|nr:helix-turn-helix transcriptional regulator [Verrucomicrobiae bacterium]
MDAHKAEFKKLVEMMGWSQTQTAMKLGKSPSAINHLLNPDHPNRPTESTLRLLKLVIEHERPDFFKKGALDVRESSASEAAASRLTAKESRLIQRLRSVRPEEQGKIYAVVATMLSNAPKGKGGKT